MLNTTNVVLTVWIINGHRYGGWIHATIEDDYHVKNDTFKDNWPESYVVHRRLFVNREEYLEKTRIRNRNRFATNWGDVLSDWCYNIEPAIFPGETATITSAGRERLQVLKSLRTVRQYPGLARHVYKYHQESIFMIEMLPALLKRWKRFDEVIRRTYVELMDDSGLTPETI